MTIEITENTLFLRAQILDRVKQQPKTEAIIHHHLALTYVRDDIERLLESALIVVLRGHSYPDGIDAMLKHIQTSQQCHDALVRQSLIPADCPWGIKQAGSMTGVTLYIKNTSGHEETIFVKSYRDKPYFGGALTPFYFNELNDYALYTIAKRCGVKTPSVRLLSAVDGDKRNVYLFVTHIAEPREKHPNKTYLFFEIHYKPAGVNISTIDHISIARMHLMTKILELKDLKDDNVGYIFSHHDVIDKTKLCMIDASSSNAELLADSKTLIELLHRHDDMRTHQGLEELLTKITQEEYIKAFEKIERNFSTVCDEICKEISAMTFESEENQRKFSEISKTWKSNFECLRSLVEAARNTPQLKF